MECGHGAACKGGQDGEAVGVEGIEYRSVKIYTNRKQHGASFGFACQFFRSYNTLFTHNNKRKCVGYSTPRKSILFAAHHAEKTISLQL